MIAVPLVILALLAGPAPALAKSGAPRACSAEIGARAAQALVRDCRDSGPAAPALCRVESPCSALRQMIAEACRLPGAEAEPACRDLREDE